MRSVTILSNRQHHLLTSSMQSSRPVTIDKHKFNFKFCGLKLIIFLWNKVQYYSTQVQFQILSEARNPMEPSHKQGRNNSPEGLFVCQKTARKVSNKANRREVLRRRHRISRNRREGLEDNTKKSILYSWLSTVTTNIWIGCRCR